MNTEPLAPYIDYEVYDGSHIQIGKELLDIDRQSTTAIYHHGNFLVITKNESKCGG